MTYQNNPRRQTVAAPKWPFVLLAVFAVLLVLGGSYLIMSNLDKATEDTPSSAQPAQPSFDKTRFSLTDPTSSWLIVNKQRQLNPKEYEPTDLRTPNMEVESTTMRVNDQTATALEELDAAAKEAGIKLTLASAYRSFGEQVTVYDSMVRGYGQAEADRQSARPGHSEHQTGWAADLGAANGKCRIELCFADTPEGKWLAANAHTYGFIIRYPEGKESITGYNYEPWHLRYVGKELAAEMHVKNISTLEEFFDLPAAPSY